jgi:hypothetical protein
MSTPVKLYTVPAGVRLVIEYVSFACSAQIDHDHEVLAGSASNEPPSHTRTAAGAPLYRAPNGSVRALLRQGLGVLHPLHASVALAGIRDTSS